MADVQPCSVRSRFVDLMPPVQQPRLSALNPMHLSPMSRRWERNGPEKVVRTNRDGLDAGSFERGKHGAGACDSTHFPWRAHVLCAGRVYGPETDIVSAFLDCLAHVLGRRA